MKEALNNLRDLRQELSDAEARLDDARQHRQALELQLNLARDAERYAQQSLDAVVDRIEGL